MTTEAEKAALARLTVEINSVIETVNVMREELKRLTEENLDWRAAGKAFGVDSPVDLVLRLKELNKASRAANENV